MKNPLDGIIPDFSVFGAQFTSLWQKLFAGFWALLIVVAIAYLAHGILAIAQNRHGGHPGQLREAKNEATRAGVALGGLIALGTIVTAFISVFA
jgi:hypothetical protein